MDVLIDKDLSRLRYILFGGEPFPVKHLQSLMALVPQARFSNVYGPTEVNQCTNYNVEGDSTVEEALPIGRVWANTESLVLDDNEQPVPQGEIGELLIRSSTMMLGYWGRPDLDARAIYLRHRAGGRADRFYRTGDLVRELDDGNLKFIGRKDRQIKTRGHRVELDEIEAVICSHERVHAAAAYTRIDNQQALLIDVAVIVRSGCQLTERELRVHVSKRLPAYARPQRITTLSDFPRTRTGKVDLQALVELINQC